MSTVIASSPATETVNDTSNHAFAFAIPAGTWTAATWTLTQTTGERLDRGSWSYGAHGINWSRSSSNTQTYSPSGSDLAAIAAAAGSTLTVTLSAYGSDIPLSITAFTLTLTGTAAAGRRRCSITYRKA